MPLSLFCTFCGKPIEPGTGLMYVRNDNQRFYFCSRKCEKNQLVLRRRARKLKWTTAYERGPSPPQPEKPPEEITPEAEPSEKKTKPSEKKTKPSEKKTKPSEKKTKPSEKKVEKKSKDESIEAVSEEEAGPAEEVEDETSEEIEDSGETETGE
jgi:large subunit ribosomal protein L24e